MPRSEAAGTQWCRLLEADSFGIAGGLRYRAATFPQASEAAAGCGVGPPAASTFGRRRFLWIVVLTAAAGRQTSGGSWHLTDCFFARDQWWSVASAAAGWLQGVYWR